MRKTVKNVATVIIAVALMFIIAAISPRIILPTGSLVAPLAGIIGISALLTLGIPLAILITVIGLVIMYLQGTANDEVFVTILVALIVMTWLRNRQSSPVSHQQLILFGIVAGILIFVLMELSLLVAGWLFDGQWSTGLAFVRLGMSSSVLAALLYGILVAPITIAWRKLNQIIS